MRVIKKYGSRKLYDTETSKYISLEEIANLIREGRQIQVLDNKTGENVTAQTLVQVISDEGRQGRSLWPTDFLHDVIRFSEKAVNKSMEQFQQLREGVDQFVEHSLDRIRPQTGVRDEVNELRKRLEELEALLQPPSNKDQTK